MRKRLSIAISAALLMQASMAVTTAAHADGKRDRIIADYYRQNPHDHDFLRWSKDRRSWTDDDYLRWYQYRTLDFQTVPGVSAAFGVDRGGNSVPGFQVY